MFRIAAPALFVLIEKVVPAGRWLERAGGVGLILWDGAWDGAALLTLIATA